MWLVRCERVTSPQWTGVFPVWQWEVDDDVVCSNLFKHQRSVLSDFAKPAVKHTDFFRCKKIQNHKCFFWSVTKCWLSNYESLIYSFLLNVQLIWLWMGSIIINSTRWQQNIKKQNYWTHQGLSDQKVFSHWFPVCFGINFNILLVTLRHFGLVKLKGMLSI